jgi:uncharacterized LabA/DUF88 family protein
MLNGLIQEAYQFFHRSQEVLHLKRVRSYIDGFNLYHAIVALDKPHLKWLNLWSLASSFLREGEVLEEVHFFTALSTSDGQKYKRHRNYIRVLQSLSVTVHEGDFQRVSRFCSRQERTCPFQEEKRTDVGIAVKMLLDAFDGVDRFLLVTADADQVPAIKSILERWQDRNVTLIAPPGRLVVARHLGSVATEYKELTEGRMNGNVLPRSVYGSDGRFIAAMPAIYLPDDSN